MSQLLFGTDGIRNKVGTPPLDQQGLFNLGRAIGIWATKKYSHQPRVLLGYDTRQSSWFVNATMQSGLLLHGIQIFDAGVVPTPAICQLVKNSSEFDLGIIIFASHNRHQDNGIKLIDCSSGKLNLSDEIEISKLYHAIDTYTISYANLGTTINYSLVYTQYQQTLARYCAPQFLHNIHVVLDCAHGATYQFAHQIFTYFGAKVDLINNSPNGTNINHECGSLFLQPLQQAVAKYNADIGFAFDGDGDRVLVVNKFGQAKNGDDILALLLNHPVYHNQTTIVGTLMSNHGLHAHLRAHNKNLIRVAVGDKFVAEQLEKDNLLLGGEQSGHIIMRDYLSLGDGIFTALRVLETILATDNWSIETFTPFPQVLINIPVTTKKDLSTSALQEIINLHEQQLHQGRLVVRYSGTEPILRVMVEDDDLAHAKLIGFQLSQELAAHI